MTIVDVVARMSFEMSAAGATPEIIAIALKALAECNEVLKALAESDDEERKARGRARTAKWRLNRPCKTIKAAEAR